MKLLLDTNILLDVLLNRVPHAAASAQVLAGVEAGAVAGAIAATSVTTIHYLAAKSVGARQARRHVETILALLEVAPITEPVLRGALGRRFPDFEDAIIHDAALASGCDGIVTRDARGFKRARLPIYSPAEVLAFLRTRGGGLPAEPQ